MSAVELTPEQLEAAVAPGGIVAGQRRLTGEEIAEAVAKRHGFKVADILGRGRQPPLVVARRELYLALRERGWSYPMIGRFVGDRDHTTVFHACASEEKRAVKKLRQRAAYEKRRAS